MFGLFLKPSENWAIKGLGKATKNLLKYAGYLVVTKSAINVFLGTKI
jgi:hypothetical protein